MRRTHFTLVPRGPARSEYAVLDTASGEVVEDRVIGHGQDTGIVLVRSRGIENAFT